MALARRDDAPGTVLLVDVDDLKQINDTMGHQAGDAALRHVAAAIHEQIRASDFAGRIGGDEFAIILTAAGGDDAAAAAARIIAAATRPSPAGEPGTSVSAGSAPISGFASPADILRCADVALYTAKRNGGNCHVGSEITPATIA